jgi:vanillate monooxygenase ferredoxin subunit
MNHMLARVVRKTVEAHDIVSIELEEVSRRALPPFSAGSHIDVHVAPGITRQYSLCNAPHEMHRYVIGVLREPRSRGGSATLHDHVSVGDLLPISEPRNHFPLEPARRSILLAGGIGVTPILCMAERLARIDADFSMHYCSRSRSRTAFIGQIERSAFASRVVMYFNDDSTGARLNLPAALGQPDVDTHIYVCGPVGFIEHVQQVAIQSGWDQDCLHAEYFNASRDDVLHDRAFKVRLASTGAIFEIPNGVSVARVLAAHGIHIPLSCEEGVCGTCVTRVLDGIPEHRDRYFTRREKAANDRFTPCCSRSTTGMLVLDL